LDVPKERKSYEKLTLGRVAADKAKPWKPVFLVLRAFGRSELPVPGVQKRYLAPDSVVADDADLLGTDTYVQVIRALIDAIAFRGIDELGKTEPERDVGGGVLVEQDHPERLADAADRAVAVDQRQLTEPAHAAVASDHLAERVDAVAAFDLDESPPFEAERHARNESSSHHRGPGEPGVSVDPLGVGHRVDLFRGEVPSVLDTAGVDVRRRLPARGPEQADA
jgi:hypothetical protein